MAPTAWTEPTTIAELRLPPGFVTDHLIRTLSYQGAMSIVDLARHLHVHADIVTQIVDPLKAAGLLESESSRSNFEALNKVRLSGAAQPRVANARQRTWYAGPLPVALEHLEQYMTPSGAAGGQANIERVLAPFFFDSDLRAELGQAVAAEAAVVVTGLAYDEQAPLASALAAALDGDVRMPYAVYAAGHVIRMLDARVHRQVREGSGELDALRERGNRSPWATIKRPLVIISGGVRATDIVPAFDEDARFYLAPAPLTAFGGVLAFCDARQGDGEVLRELVRLWLSPGRLHCGVLLLRSGERIEIPWHATTLIMSEAAGAAEALGTTVPYTLDVTRIVGGALAAFLAQRLVHGDAVPEPAVARLADLLTDADLATRPAAAYAARYLRHRSAYEGDAFSASEQSLQAAVQHAAIASRRPAASLRVAA